MKPRLFLALAFLALLAAVSTASAGVRLDLNDPIRLADDQCLKAVYVYPHWFEPWKSDDTAVAADFAAIASLGFNTVCLDHEVSQALNRDWYWLDREYRLARENKVRILPWLQLQASDRQALEQFAHASLRPAVGQDGKEHEDAICFRDAEFKSALAAYIKSYLDRYAEDPALLRVMWKGKPAPVVGIMVELGWSNVDRLPLSFDNDTNAYFRKWTSALYNSKIALLNQKWGTDYRSFEDIDPCDKKIFNYAHVDRASMPLPVKEHMLFRAMLIDQGLRDVVKAVRGKHKNVVFAVEVAYPFGEGSPDVDIYQWNNANDPSSVAFADILFIRTMGDTAMGKVQKEQMRLVSHGRKVVAAYRFLAGETPGRAAGYALDCALSANGLAYYNWNEMDDAQSALYNRPEWQGLAKTMNMTYDLLNNPDSRHNERVQPVAVPSGEGLPASSVQPLPTETQPAETAPAPQGPEPQPEVQPVPPAPVPAPAVSPAPVTGTPATAPAPVTAPAGT